MHKLSGKRDTEVKTVVTEDVKNDIAALATMYRCTTGHLLRHIIHNYLYGRVGIVNIGMDVTELKAKR